MKHTHLILISLLVCLLLVGGVQANAFSAWSAYGDAWKATNDTYTIVMWNQPGSHTWNANGNASSVEYLVVAGGAGGGTSAGGGGGAGGVRNGTATGLSGGITIVVGNGGGANTKGGNSTFSTISATGGGTGNVGGGNANGGSGGGATNAEGSGGTGNLGGYTPVEGYGGGSSVGNYGGGGGGGWGSVGANTVSYTGGGGGSGAQSSITGTLTYYAGGGGGGARSPAGEAGGAGGSGIGGTGASSSTYATVGQPNTGSGGGGGHNTAPQNVGAAGGSGIVIIQYLTLSPPIASFTANTTSGTAPLAVLLTDTSTGIPTNWSWGAKNLTGNNTWTPLGTTQNLTQVFGVGNWSLNVTATNAVGSNVSTQVTWVNVTRALQLLSQFLPVVNQSGTAPYNVQFYDTSGWV